MKLVKILKINGKSTPIVSDALALELKTPGRAIFAIQSKTPVAGLIELFLGSGKNYEKYFTGYIESCQQIDDKQQRIVCREYSAILSARLPISLRHKTITEALTVISEKTGLKFILEPHEWNNKIIPLIHNTGTGYSLLDFFGYELEIHKYIWLPLPDGEIYIGSWLGCPLAKANILEIPVSYVKDISSIGTTIQMIPKLRPGIHLKIGNSEPIFVTKVEPSANHMRFNFDKNPWDKIFKKAASA